MTIFGHILFFAIVNYFIVRPQNHKLFQKVTEVFLFCPVIFAADYFSAKNEKELMLSLFNAALFIGTGLVVLLVHDGILPRLKRQKKHSGNTDRSNRH